MQEKIFSLIKKQNGKTDRLAGLSKFKIIYNSQWHWECWEMDILLCLKRLHTDIIFLKGWLKTCTIFSCGYNFLLPVISTLKDYT